MRAPLTLCILALQGCIIPDIDVVVYATQGCGDQFIASTSSAWGYTGSGELKYILIDDQPVSQTWCLSPEESALMAFEDSWIYIQIRESIIGACYDRAIELELGQVNCDDMANIAYSGECPGEQAWCEEDAERETDSETKGESADEVGTPP